MNASRSILVIDDEDSICLAFRRFFEARGWAVQTAASAAAGLAAYRQGQPDVVFLDVRLPDRSGLDLLGELAGAQAKVIVITAYGGLDTAVRAIQGKAYDYLVKPLDLDQALALAERVCAAPAAAAAAGGPPAGGDLLVGNSPAMQEVFKLIARAAATATPVLVQGETGTGKEVVARAIHQFSARRHGPFVAVNCGAIPENLIESELFGHVRGAFTGADGDRVGRFELATGGTLLLDEVGELSPAAQVKLLRVLDTGSIERVGSSRSLQLDVRIVAATNRELLADVQRERFRQDLFHRLLVLRLALPPLRERREDIVPLARHFLARRTVAGGPPPALSAAAGTVLERYDWPGNVRELKNAMDHALTVAPDRTLTPADLPAACQPGAGTRSAADERLREAVVAYVSGLAATPDGRYAAALAQVDRALLAHALERAGGNQSAAADYLGLHRNTLRNKLRGPTDPAAGD